MGLYRYGTCLFIFTFVLSCFLANVLNAQDDEGYNKDVNFLADGLYEKPIELEEPGKRQFLSTGKRQFLSAGYGYAGKRDPEAQFIAGKRDGQFVAGKRIPQFVQGKREAQFIAGKRDPQFIQGKREAQFIAGKRDPQFISGKRDSQFYAGKRDPQFISG